MITLMKSRKAGLAILAAVGLAVAGCRHRALGTPAGPVPAKEEPCWWTVFRTPLPLDTVTAHLVGAFTTLGLAGASSSQQGDTTWAQAGPTRLDDWRGATYSARMAAFRRGDSTLYRYFVAVEPPPGGWPPEYDTVTTDGRAVRVNPSASAIGFCQAIARVSANNGTSPSEPNGEELLTVWRRRE